MFIAKPIPPQRRAWRRDSWTVPQGPYRHNKPSVLVARGLLDRDSWIACLIGILLKEASGTGILPTPRSEAPTNRPMGNFIGQQFLNVMSIFDG